jgi:acetyl-CoA acyltransferase
LEDVYIIGASMTPFGKHFDQSVKSLTVRAVREALADAGATTADLQLALYANTTQGVMERQYCVGGQIALREAGIKDIPVMNVENACASSSTALHQAIAYVRAGMADVALAVGVEKMHSPDRVRSSEIFNGAWDVNEADNVVASLAMIGDGVEVPAGKEGGVQAPFMELYASVTRGFMREFGLTERQLAAVASKNHHHSTKNPLSQFQRDFSIDEVLGGALICWPLTLPMCSPISDGASAAIICSKEALSRFPEARPIKIMASVLASAGGREWADFENHICRKAALTAYDQAGIGPSDISVAEVHDASAFGEIIQIENLGFCELGQGGWISERGETSLGGRIPVNPSGGLESKGHPIGATGLAQIYELVTQLRGDAGARQVEGARFAIAENGGGFLGVEEAAAVVTILGR